MLVENGYPGDPRVRREATALVEAGYEVTVVGLREERDEPWTGVVDGVHIYRLPELTLFKKTPTEDPGWLAKGLSGLSAVVGYLVEYTYFTTGCFVLALYLAFRRGFDVIHAHNPPDTLFAVGLFFRLFGKRFVFDIHDLSAELYQSRYGVKGGKVSRILRWLERASLKTANVVVVTNESYKATAIERGGLDPTKVFVVRNGPDLRKVKPAEPDSELRASGKTILAYLGALNPQDGVDYLLRALDHLVHELDYRDVYCVVMGSGDSLGDLRDLAAELKLDDYVSLPGYVPDDQMLATLAAADICVDPDPSSPLNDVSTWIKIMEYMAAGKPIVTFDLKETRFSAQDAALYVPPNNEAGFAEAIVELMADPERRDRMGAFGRQRVESELQWTVVREQLYAAYAALQVGK